MEKLTRRRCTLEYQQKSVRLVSSDQKVAAPTKALGIVEQALANWVKAEKAGQLRGAKSGQVSAERLENIRLQAELARVITEGDILGKSRRTSRRCSDEVRLDRAEQVALAGAVPDSGRERFGISSAPGAAEEDSHAPPP